MRELFQAREAKKPRGPFDRVDRPKNVGQQPRVAGARLKVGQASLHPVQAFLALDEELSRQLVHAISVPAAHSHVVPVEGPSHGLYRRIGARLEEGRAQGNNTADARNIPAVGAPGPGSPRTGPCSWGGGLDSETWE